MIYTTEEWETFNKKLNEKKEWKRMSLKDKFEKRIEQAIETGNAEFTICLFDCKEFDNIHLDGVAEEMVDNIINNDLIDSYEVKNMNLHVSLNREALHQLYTQLREVQKAEKDFERRNY